MTKVRDAGLSLKNRGNAGSGFPPVPNPVLTVCSHFNQAKPQVKPGYRLREGRAKGDYETKF